MITVAGMQLESLPLVGNKKVRDIAFFDGPLLSHFKNDRGDQYLYYWCDCDDTHHRWMVLRVNENNIVRLVNNFVPLSYIIPNGSQDDFVYFIDVDGEGKTRRVLLTLKRNIPKEYLPDTGASLMPVSQKDQNSYPVLIEGRLELDDLVGVPTKYTQAYSLWYALNEMLPSSFTEFPWRGGFSAMFFYDELENILPGEERPEVEVFQYASPGFIRFKVRRQIADELTTLIRQFADTKSDAYLSWRFLLDYITEHKLNDLRKTNRDANGPAWQPYNAELVSRTTKLLFSMNVREPKSLLSAVHAPFEAAKISSSLARRLRKLAMFEKDGSIKFPRVAPESKATVKKDDAASKLPPQASL